MVVYDKEKEDAPFSPEEDPSKANGTDTSDTASGTSSGNRIQINKSVHSKNQKTNPVAAWKLSNQRINAFAFSPDNRHLAVVSEDGTLRIIDYLKEEYTVPDSANLDGDVLTCDQAFGYLLFVLWRIVLCLLVARWQVRAYWRARRPDFNLVCSRVSACSTMSGTSIVGSSCCL